MYILYSQIRQRTHVTVSRSLYISHKAKCHFFYQLMYACQSETSQCPRLKDVKKVACVLNSENVFRICVACQIVNSM